MTIEGYYRYPTIHKNKVVFVGEDDLWGVTARGGVARRLTANLGMTSHPVFSPNGKLLAFIGREDGEAEVYVMPAVGGQATRLTFLGSSTTVLGWTPDSKKIVFASDAGVPFRSLTNLYTISLTGGQPEPLPYGPARSISFGPDGGVVLGRRAQELANWKRYRGGTAGDIWIDTKGKGRFKLLLKLKSNVVSPIWLGDRIYFLSDHEGIGNLYSCTLTGKNIRRHTHHEDYYARQPASDGHRIIYRAGADLHIFDPTATVEGKAVRKLKVQFHTPRVQRNRKFIKASAHLEHYTLHPEAHSVAMTVRGKPFTFSNWEGATFQYGQPHSVRYRLVEWLNDGKRLVMFSDASGEEALEIHADASQSSVEVSPERLEGLDIGRPIFLKVSPKNDEIILANHRYELIHIDLSSKAIKVLDKSDFGRIAGADWSPDGKWVVYGFNASRNSCAIKLCQVETGQTVYVTPPNNLYDFGPSFDPAGKYIYFISYREFDPVYDSHYFDLNFPRGSRPYLVTLQKDTPTPFVPQPNHTADNDDKRGDENEGTAAEGRQKNGQSKEKPPDEKKEEKPLQIDLAGIEKRIAVFPVPESRYQQIRGIKDKVLFTSAPIEGSLNRGWRDHDNEVGNGVLEMYDLVERKKEYIVNGINSFEVSRNRKCLIYRSGKNLRVLKAAEKPDNNSAGYTKKSGWLQLSRLRVAVNPPDEWQQMFREAWRLQRDHFWTEDMSKVDWEEIYKRYFRLIDRVATRSEFSDLMWEMQGELSTSHAYELGGDYRTTPRYRQGFLGADFTYEAEAGGYRVTHIVQGDPWVRRFDSPLNRLGVNVQVGDLILSIDGRRLGPDISPQQVLVNRADTEVQLIVVSPNQTAEKSKVPKDKSGQEDEQAAPRTVLVKTLSDETRARYREWVENNRRRVHEETGGRVGYVHIPDMGPFGYAEFHRYYRSESEREGLLVDVRFNGGGHVSQLLVEKLARRRLGYRKPRYGEAWSYPSEAVLGPMVALTNEYAGSDGDIFSHVFKLMGLGPLIGKRTWGGVIGIWPRHALVDGTLTTQPEVSTWFEDVGWGVENYGTDPDIEVDIKPQDYARGKDPQLDRGIKEILRILKENPPEIPDFGPKPSRALPKLPKLKQKR